MKSVPFLYICILVISEAMAQILRFEVEEFYRGRIRPGEVVLSDEEMNRLQQYFRETDEDADLYNSDLDRRCPDIYRKIDEAALPLMQEMDALLEKQGRSGEIDEKYPLGFYRVDLVLPEQA